MSKYENIIVIGLPHTGEFLWQTTMSLLGLSIPNGFKVLYHMIGNSLVYDAREKIVKFAREKKAKYTVMFDSDMVVPKNFLVRTVGLLEEKEDIHMVTGTIFKRTPPFQPCFYTELNYDLQEKKPKLTSPIEFPEKGLLPLAGMGLACCTIKNEVFDMIDEKKKEKTDYFYPFPNLGEDLTFCLVARKCGANMVCDLELDVGHISAMPIHQTHYKACYEEWKKNNSGSPIFGEGAVTK